MLPTQSDKLLADSSAADRESIQRTVVEEPRRSFVSFVHRLLGGDRFSFLAAKVAKETTDANREIPLPERIGRFDVIRELGRGGFGVVYLAYDPTLARKVAIKLPYDWLANDPAASARYLKEAQLLSKLQHPGIVTVYDTQVRDGRIEYIVQKFEEGTTLHDLMSHRRLSVRRTVELILKIAEAIQAAHQLGIYHRDLKPANVIVDSQGGAHVLDFGLAIDEETQLQLRGQVAGTVAYMSPEQLQGDSHHLDGRTDIWSLGVMFYEMLTGRKPFRGNSQETAEQVIHRQPVAPRQFHSTIPKRIEACCLKCLQKPIADRYSSATDLIEELHEILANEALSDEESLVLAPDPTAPAQVDTKRLQRDATKAIPKQRRKTNGAWWWVGGIVVCALALGGFATLLPLITAAWSGSKNLSDIDLLATRPIRLIYPSSDFNTDSYDKGRLSLQSRSGCMVLFEPQIELRDYDIHLELWQIGDWKGALSFFHGMKPSKTKPNRWVGFQLEFCRDDKDPNRWNMHQSQVLIDPTQGGIIITKEIKTHIKLTTPPKDIQELVVQVRNGQIKTVTIGGIAYAEPGLATLSNLDYVVALDQENGIFRHNLDGQIGIKIRRTSVVVSKAVVLRRE